MQCQVFERTVQIKSDKVLSGGAVFFLHLNLLLEKLIKEQIVLWQGLQVSDIELRFWWRWSFSNL